MLNKSFICHLSANCADSMFFLRLIITLCNLKYLHWICRILSMLTVWTLYHIKYSDYYCLVWGKVVKTCLINFMRSSNWCKRVAEISARSWKMSNSLWVCGAWVTAGSVHTQMQSLPSQVGHVAPSPLFGVTAFFLPALTNTNCNAEGKYKTTYISVQDCHQVSLNWKSLYMNR